MSEDSCSILACQVSIPFVGSELERDQQVQSMISKIDERLNQQPAELIVLPELSSVAYSRNSFELLSILAEDFDGPTVTAMRNLAQKYQTAVLFGMPSKRDGQYFISQIGIAANGEWLGCYDKLHICQYGASMEKEYFQRGSGLLVFEINGFKFAPIICYDIRIPELSRSLTINHKVDCILHCAAYYRDESFASWHAFATTRAMENQLYLLSLNRAGPQYGDSVFCLPWMDENHRAINFSAHDEDFRYLKLDRECINAARENYTFLRDRLNDYGDLSS